MIDALIRKAQAAVSGLEAEREDVSRSIEFMQAAVAGQEARLLDINTRISYFHDGLVKLLEVNTWLPGLATALNEDLSATRLLDRRIADIDFGKGKAMNTRIMYALQNGCAEYVGDVVQMTQHDCYHLRHFGLLCKEAVETYLKANGLSLGMKVPEWKRPKEE